MTAQKPPRPRPNWTRPGRFRCSFPVWADPAALDRGVSVQGVRLPGEEVRHPLRRGGAGAKLRVLCQQLPGGGLGFLEEQGVAPQVRHLQPRQAVLPLAEEVSRALRRRRSSSAILKPSAVFVMTFSRARVSSLRLSEIRMQ